MFGTAEMRAVFTDESLIGRYLEAEAALARAQARMGAVPQDAEKRSTPPRRRSRSTTTLLRHETETVGYPILPLVHQLLEGGRRRRALYCIGARRPRTSWTPPRAADPRGARDLSKPTSRESAAISPTCAALYATRRWPAAPICSRRCRSPSATRRRSGSPVDRHTARLDAGCGRGCWSAQFAGAAGTLASLGEGGLEMLAALRAGARPRRAGDHLACRPRRHRRDRDIPRPLSGSLGKIAIDVMLMSATEFGEAAEPSSPGRGSSSTMPQKRNPISCELMLAAAKALRQHAAPCSTRWSTISSAPPAHGISNGWRCRRASFDRLGPCQRELHAGGHRGP